MFAEDQAVQCTLVKFDKLFCSTKCRNKFEVLQVYTCQVEHELHKCKNKFLKGKGVFKFAKFFCS